jgi:hypothetical protein
MHQLKMKPFKPFCKWTKNPSSLIAQGFFSPFSDPKSSPPSYLPHLISRPHHLESSIKLSSFSPRELHNTWLKEGWELNIVGTWRGEGKRSIPSQKRKREKKGKFPPLNSSKMPSPSSLIMLQWRIRWRQLPSPPSSMVVVIKKKKKTMATIIAFLFCGRFLQRRRRWPLW